MSAAYALRDYVEDLRAAVAECADEDAIFRRVGPLARRFALDRSWLEPRYYDADEDQGFGVHLLHEEPDHTLAVFAVSWLPGRGTPPHDHGTWAVVAGIDGVERNIRYNRLDDRGRDGYAELEIKHAFDAAVGDVVCMRNGGIHRVVNETDAVTLSLHSYGRHINFTERSQYDPERNEEKAFKLKIAD